MCWSASVSLTMYGMGVALSVFCLVRRYSGRDVLFGLALFVIAHMQLLEGILWLSDPPLDPETHACSASNRFISKYMIGLVLALELLLGPFALWAERLMDGVIWSGFWSTVKTTPHLDAARVVSTLLSLATVVASSVYVYMNADCTHVDASHSHLLWINYSTDTRGLYIIWFAVYSLPFVIAVRGGVTLAGLGAISFIAWYADMTISTTGTLWCVGGTMASIFLLLDPWITGGELSVIKVCTCAPRDRYKREMDPHHHHHHRHRLLGKGRYKTLPCYVLTQRSVWGCWGGDPSLSDRPVPPTWEKTVTRGIEGIRPPSVYAKNTPIHLLFGWADVTRWAAAMEVYESQIDSMGLSLPPCSNGGMWLWETFCECSRDSVK
jgi:hypothetical protein